MNRKPRPTKFSGTVYRSKTEAMFVLLKSYWAMKKNRRFTLLYEPFFLQTSDGYIPDFLEIEIPENFPYIDSPQNHNWMSIYEVKPDYPNETYLSYLEKQFREIISKDKKHLFSFFTLVIFNPYNNLYEYTIYDTEEGKLYDGFERPLWVTDDLFEFVINYRFDLS